MGLMNAVSSAANHGAELYARGALADLQAEIQAKRDARLAALQEQSGIRTEARADARANKQRTDQTARIDAAAGDIAEKAVEGKRGLINSRIEDKSSWTPEQQAAVDQSMEIDRGRVKADPKTRTQAAIATGDIDPKTAATFGQKDDAALYKMLWEQSKEDRRDSRASNAEDARDLRQQRAFDEADKRAERKEKEKSQGKALPISAAKALLENQTNLRRAQTALALVSGEEVDGIKGDTDATGKKGWLPNQLLNRMDAEGVDTRAAIADLGSLVIHDRSGAAVTASEFPRLAPFIPTEKDDAATVRKKLGQFTRNYQAVIDDTKEFYEASGYKVPTESLRSGKGGKPSPASPAIQVQSSADVEALPSGAIFTTPDGKTRRKP